MAWGDAEEAVAQRPTRRQEGAPKPQIQNGKAKDTCAMLEFVSRIEPAGEARTASLHRAS